MAQGHIKKGFFFYFGLFVLLLLAAFLICLVIMMFNPGTTVLWMQYFTANSLTYINGTTATAESAGEEIDWSTVTDIEIVCSYSDVIVERDNNDDYPKTGVYIENDAKGFTAASSAVAFDINVSYTANNAVKIEITEPTGFLYISKSIKVIVHAYNKENVSSSTPNFDGVNLTVKTTSGNVNLGGTENLPDGSVLTKIKSATVETGSGNIYISRNMDTSSFQELNLSTTSGKIYSTATVAKTLSYASTATVTGLSTTCDITLTTEKGTVDLDAIYTTGALTINNKSGSIVLGDVIATSVSFIECNSGNYKLNAYAASNGSGVTAGVVSFGSENTVSSANIMFGKINGEFIFNGSSEDNNCAPTIDIESVTGKVTVYSKKGSLNVDSAEGAVNVNSEGSLSVNVVLSENNNNAVYVTNGSGDVTLGFAGVVSADQSALSGVTVISDSGTVVVNVTSAASFVASVYENDETTLKDLSKISVSIGDKSNPLTVNGGSGSMDLSTSAKVYFFLVSASDL